MRRVSELARRRSRMAVDGEKRMCSGGGPKDEEDRISELPDTLWLQILILLRLKWAIHTGKLSWRWLNL